MTPEQLIETGKAMQAYGEARKNNSALPTIQVRFLDGWHDCKDLQWTGVSYEYRIKPEPKLIPYTKDTFPLGAWVRGKEERLPMFPFIVNDKGLFFGTTTQFTWEHILDLFEITTDGGKTWGPAGQLSDSR